MLGMNARRSAVLCIGSLLLLLSMMCSASGKPAEPPDGAVFGDAVSDPSTRIASTLAPDNRSLSVIFDNAQSQSGQSGVLFVGAAFSAPIHSISRPEILNIEFHGHAVVEEGASCSTYMAVNGIILDTRHNVTSAIQSKLTFSLQNTPDHRISLAIVGACTSPFSGPLDAILTLESVELSLERFEAQLPPSSK